MTTEALTLVDHHDLDLHHHHDPNPALLYLSQLAPTGRRSMRTALERILNLIGNHDHAVETFAVSARVDVQ